MPARHYQLPLGAAALRVSDAFGDGANVVNAQNDVPMRQVILQVSGADAFLGGPTVSTTDYGVLLDSATQDRVILGPFESGGVKLSQFYAVGASSVLHILAVPY